MSDKKRKFHDKDTNSNKKVQLTEEIKIQIKEINDIKNKYYIEIDANISKNIKLRKQINELDAKLKKICPHKWVRDWDQYEPCGPTPKICEYCGL